MSWADCVFQDWDDCVWQDTTDNELDEFESQDRTAGTRTVRLLPAEFPGNFRRPYLEGNPSYVEDSQRYSDAAIATALYKATGEIRSDMIFKQPYRYDEFLKMKYWNEPAFPHHETMSAQNLVETPGDILDEGIPEGEIEYEWVWIKRLNDYYWDSYELYVHGLTHYTTWFDNRWLGNNTGEPTYDPGVILIGKGVFTSTGGVNWYRDFFPLKLRVECRDVTGLGYPIYLALVDEDVNTIALSTNYTSGEELGINFNGKVPFGALAVWLERGAGTEIGEFEVTNIEFALEVEKGTYLGSGQRMPRIYYSEALVKSRAGMPLQIKIYDSVRLARHTNLRTTR